jgi:hypothetical protein
MAAMLASASVLVGGLPAQAGDIPVLIFSVDIGDCFHFQGAAHSHPVTVTWKDQAGHLKKKFTGTPSDDLGFWYPPFQACDSLRVAVGDRIKAFDGSNLRTFVVPKLTVAFDRTTNVVSGKAQAGEELFVRVQGSNLFSDVTEDCQTTTTVSVAGVYEANVAALSGGSDCLPDYDPAGGDSVDVNYEDADSDTISRYGQASYVWVSLGSSYLGGAVAGGQRVNLHLRSAGGHRLADAQAKGNVVGDFEARLRSPGGSPVKVKAGERVSGDWAGTVSFTVPAMSISLGTNGRIRGHCMSLTPYQLSAEANGAVTSDRGVTDSQGRTTQWPPGLVHDGDHLVLACERPSGDVISTSRVFH